jgi:hypothetical protein
MGRADEGGGRRGRTWVWVCIWIPLLYALSIGPVARWNARDTWLRHNEVIRKVFMPILIVRKVPFVRSILMLYLEAWGGLIWCPGDGCISEHFPATEMNTIDGMLSTFRAKGYGGYGRTYPVGNDPTCPNNGKFCGLYYQTNRAGDRITLIGVADANADYRAGLIYDEGHEGDSIRTARRRVMATGSSWRPGRATGSRS